MCHGRSMVFKVPISHGRLDNFPVMTVFVCEIKMWKNYLNGYQWIEGRKMKVGRLLKHQMSGSDVALLQMKLKELGYLTNRADGVLGIITKHTRTPFVHLSITATVSSIDNNCLPLLISLNISYFLTFIV